MTTVHTPKPLLDPAQRTLILLELDRVVESPVFRQSKRCCRFLRHTVSAVLEDRHDALRERSLGVELFDRQADYWTSDDAIVRVAAAEVRKRLAQFYDLNGVEHGLRIDLPSGGYVPDFRWTDTPPAKLLSIPSTPWLKAAVALLAVAILAASAIWATRSPFTSFWAPIVHSREPVLISLGLVEGYAGGIKASQFKERVGTECADNLEKCRALLSKFQPIVLDSVPTGDVVGIARLMSFLGQQNKAFRIRGFRDVSYSDIKESDSILVAYFSNPWTVETHKTTRFRLKYNSRRPYVVDDQRPGFQDWAMVGSGWPSMDSEVDYAIVTRLEDPKTGKTRVVIGGFTPYGTEAALTLASTEKAMNAALRNLPSGWDSKNLQIVLRTTITAMMPGPPEILAVHVW